MKISVQSVNFNIDGSLTKYIEKKVSNLEKFHDNIIGAEIFLKVQNSSEKENKISELKISLPGNDIVVKKQSKSFEAGISLSLDVVKRQLLKRKEKLKV
ncbi:MAG: ribosome-associated translation inhibitor RaiA [Flavobacteriaceae bacterium]|nr:ribosome-associated translation inhibitor RaiA [Flavobacteriaceae bacterium]